MGARVVLLLLLAHLNRGGLPTETLREHLHISAVAHVLPIFWAEVDQPTVILGATVYDRLDRHLEATVAAHSSPLVRHKILDENLVRVEDDEFSKALHAPPRLCHKTVWCGTGRIKRCKD